MKLFILDLITAKQTSNPNDGYQIT